MILAIDVGKGTEDVLLYDPAKPIENSLQLVSPSQAQILYQQLSREESEQIVISGELMAGEPYHKIIYQKCNENPESVIMSKTAARSLRYNIDQVRAKGVKIVSDEELGNYTGARYFLSDVNWKRIKHILQDSNINPEDIDTVLLACQDHGEPDDPTQSTRDFRMKTIYSKLDSHGRIEDIIMRFSDIPDYLPRHKSIAQSTLNAFEHLQSTDIWAMDSSPAVVLGAKTKSDEIVVNIGNGHSLAVLFRNDLVYTVYETHTGAINPDHFEVDIYDLLTGKLDHQEALNRGAHGVYLSEHFIKLNNKQIDQMKPFTLIGPNREKLHRYLDMNLVHPGGNMMMAGPIGLLKAYKYVR